MKQELKTAIIIATALLFLTSSCNYIDNYQQTRPNIIFIIADDLSWEHLGAYGYKDISTPHIDRLAQKGVLFTNAFVSTSSCTASRASILTGRNGFELEQGACLWGYLPEKFTTYPELLEANGYKVGGTGKGWGPGFLMERSHNPAGKLYNDIEYEPYKMPGKNIWISKNDYASNFNVFLEESKGEPFCFWMGTYEPHRGYAPGLAESQGHINADKIEVPPFLPDNVAVKNDINDYLFEVEHIDKQVGKMIEVLNRHQQLENTLIVFTSDNGMPFPRAKATLYDYGTRMPLILWWGKNISGGRAITDFISLTDIAPTFLDAAGIKVPEEMSGESILPQLLSDESGRIDQDRSKVILYRERHSFCCPGGETFASRGIRTDDYLLIWNSRTDILPGDVDRSPSKQLLIDNRSTWPKLYDLSFGRRPEYELYNLENDPYQMHNLAFHQEYSVLKNSLKTKLFGYLEERNDPRLSGSEDIFTNTPYFGFLFELGMLNWAQDEDGRRLTQKQIIGLLNKAYQLKGEEETFKRVAEAENWVVPVAQVE